MTPTSIRSNINLIITYQLNELDWYIICRELVREDYKKCREVLSFVFTDTKKSFLIYRCDTNKFYKNFNPIPIL